ncbi:YbfB/YjiJ family MFS transporter [Streptomyces tremellae]|uniref:YbfB/YjiJ family MFS transporter n=1 Tax=Streptomyces tremellae TaxID=1124239 RepID=A0ABP7FHB4_9ACTN
MAAEPPSASAGGSPWPHVLRAGAALGAGMGVGRFVYTPILPLMQAQAGLTAAAGADLATANYAGYLAGALAGSLSPRLARSRAALRVSLAVLVATVAAMPLTRDTSVWLGLRCVAGAASTLVFVIAVTGLLHRLRGGPAHLSGWAFGGVGAGIALSGLLVLALRQAADWRAAWWASAALTALLAAASSAPRAGDAATGARPRHAERATAPGDTAARGGPGGADVTGARGGGSPAEQPPRTHRWFGVLLAGYTLEGVGYVVAGTFLVAAIGRGSPGALGSGAWVLVGLAAVPASALWTALGRRFTRPGLLAAALVVQAVGTALPAVAGGAVAALAAAVLFGGTFLGVSTLALAIGAHLRFPRSVALLTAGYSAGQIAGPLAVAPLLHHGYQHALLLAAAVTGAAALCAGALRAGFPHRMPEPGSGHGTPGGPEPAGPGRASPGRGAQSRTGA